MRTKTSTKSATVNVPLTAVRYLYKNVGSRTVVCEIDLSAFKKVNEPNTLDEMVAEARLERMLGKTKSFTSARALIKDLRS